MNEVKIYKPDRFKNKAPFFSIIIVSYNYAHTLPRTLTALKKQTFKDFEIVFVDNGSTDNTDKLINRFITKNKDLYITHVKIEDNNGLPPGRNMGIDNSHGEYIIFNDADDWMEKNCLEEMKKASQDGKIDRVMVQMRDISPEGRILQVREFVKDMSPWYIIMLQGNAFKRKYFEEYNIRVPDTFEDDLYISLTFTSYACSYKVIRETLYNIYINPDSTSGANSITEIKRIQSVMQDVIDVMDPIRKKVSSKDWQFLEYQLIKSYYTVIFHTNRNRKYREIKKVYRILNGMIKGFDNEYLKNSKLTLKSNGDRFYGRLITYVFSKIERFHLMVPFLYLYVTLSKFIYFNV